MSKVKHTPGGGSVMKPGIVFILLALSACGKSGLIPSASGCWGSGCVNTAPKVLRVCNRLVYTEYAPKLQNYILSGDSLAPISAEQVQSLAQWCGQSTQSGSGW